MQSDTTCPIVEQYLAYLVTIRGRSKNTVIEYRLDILQFFRYVARCRGSEYTDFQYANIEFICSIQLGDMYAFLAYCQNTLNSSPGTRARKIVSIRQFWKYLKTKAHLINNNIAEELETPKQPKRIVRCLTLEESVRLLIEAGAYSARDNCIITIFLNCALRLSELAALNVDQVEADVMSVIGKGNKERKIYLTPAVKQALSQWLAVRSTFSVDTNALFISRNRNRLTTRSIQNVVKKHIVASGISPEGLSTHKLRHYGERYKMVSDSFKPPTYQDCQSNHSPFYLYRLREIRKSIRFLSSHQSGRSQVGRMSTYAASKAFLRVSVSALA